MQKVECNMRVWIVGLSAMNNKAHVRGVELDTVADLVGLTIATAVMEPLGCKALSNMFVPLPLPEQVCTLQIRNLST